MLHSSSLPASGLLKVLALFEVQTWLNLKNFIKSNLIKPYSTSQFFFTFLSPSFLPATFLLFLMKTFKSFSSDSNHRAITDQYKLFVLIWHFQRSDMFFFLIDFKAVKYIHVLLNVTLKILFLIPKCFSLLTVKLNTAQSWVSPNFWNYCSESPCFNIRVKYVWRKPSHRRRPDRSWYFSCLWCQLGGVSPCCQKIWQGWVHTWTLKLPLTHV